MWEEGPRQAAGTEVPGQSTAQGHLVPEGEAGQHQGKLRPGKALETNAQGWTYLSQCPALVPARDLHSGVQGGWPHARTTLILTALSAGESMIELERERESEEDEEGGGTTDTAPMLPQSLPSRRSAAAQGLRLLLHLLLSGRALVGLLLYLLLPASVFLLVLLPAATTVYVGFLCHSRVSRDPLHSGIWDPGQGVWGMAPCPFPQGLFCQVPPCAFVC